MNYLDYFIVALHCTAEMLGASGIFSQLIAWHSFLILGCCYLHTNIVPLPTQKRLQMLYLHTILFSLAGFDIF